MLKSLLLSLVFSGIFLLTSYSLGAQTSPIIIDHRHIDIWDIPDAAITQAKNDLHIAYGHTSHGSQLISGMGGTDGAGLDTFMTANGAPQGLFVWHDGPQPAALDLDDYAMGGDVGYYPQWLNNTHAYLGTPDSTTGRGTSHPDVNVILWSWCGQAASRTEETMLSTYLTPMAQLELEYPGIVFVYMTGHLDGSGPTGNLNLRNQQIRDYCTANNKVLYDFADIESYDPDGLVNYMELNANDNCDYDSDGNGSKDTNWALSWQASHTQDIDWWASGASHSQHINGNMKGWAAWWLWARIAGWQGPPTNLAKSISALQVVAGLTPFSTLPPDVNDDDRTGLAESIFFLKEEAQ